MGTPQARLRVAGHDVLLLGTIAGFVPDAERVRQAYEAFRPQLVALGVPPEDLPGLDALAAAARPELPELDVADEKRLALLARFGATRVPSPDLEAAHELARRDQVPLAALDLDDEAHAAAFTRHVTFLTVLRSNAIKSRLLRHGVAGGDPYAVMGAWDAAWNRPKGLRRVEEDREACMAQRLKEEAATGTVLAVVPAARLPGIVRALADP